jgi:type 1 glutamine amidotransferase
MLRSTFILFLFLFTPGALTAGEPVRIVLIAGKPSHPSGEHEFNAGITILDRCLRLNKDVQTQIVRGGWPSDESVFEGASTLVFYMDGGSGHPIIQGNHLDKIGRLMKKGVGLTCLHYAIEVPKEKGGKEFLEWLGGYYETGYSQNPVNYVAVKQATPKHPISRGWTSFAGEDEWYFRIRFRPDDPRVTPILSALLPPAAPNREVVAWATQRDDGGRGFGFCGGHFYRNWNHRDLRQVIVNGILWTAKADIPRNGAKCDIPADELIVPLDNKSTPVRKKK